MRKSLTKVHTLEQSIHAFQQSPLCEVMTSQKKNHVQLKKIGKNKLSHKESTLPIINPNSKNKQNTHIQPSQQLKVNPKLETPTKNYSFVRSKTANFGHERISRMIKSQKLNVSIGQMSKMKHQLIENQVIVNNRILKPHRYCNSAEIKKVIPQHKQNTNERPQQLRRVAHLRKSKQIKSEDLKQIPFHIQAQRLAYEGRPFQNANEPESKKNFSLQDFLNDWKAINLV